MDPNRWFGPPRHDPKSRECGHTVSNVVLVTPQIRDGEGMNCAILRRREPNNAPADKP